MSEENKLNGKEPVTEQELLNFFKEGKITQEQYLGALINAYGARKTVEMFQNLVKSLKEPDHEPTSV